MPPSLWLLEGLLLAAEGDEPTVLCGLTPEAELARAEAGVHAGAAETNGHMHDDGVLLCSGCVCRVSHGRAVLQHCTRQFVKRTPQLRSWHEVAGPNRLSDTRTAQRGCCKLANYRDSQSRRNPGPEFE